MRLHVAGGKDGLDGNRDAFDTVIAEVKRDSNTPILVIGEAASGKSTLARLFLVQCVQQMQGLELVP